MIKRSLPYHQILTVVIPKIFFELLKRWRVDQGKIRLVFGNKWHSPKNIFSTDDSHIMNPATGPKWFSEFLKKNNFYI